MSRDRRCLTKATVPLVFTRVIFRTQAVRTSSEGPVLSRTTFLSWRHKSAFCVRGGRGHTVCLARSRGCTHVLASRCAGPAGVVLPCRGGRSLKDGSSPEVTELVTVGSGWNRFCRLQSLCFCTSETRGRLQCPLFPDGRGSPQVDQLVQHHGAPEIRRAPRVPPVPPSVCVFLI